MSKTWSRLSVVWRVLVGLIYLGIAIAILSVSKSPFETLVLAVLIQLYAAVLYNFSLMGAATDINNYAGFVRFRILATAQGLTEDENGLFVDQEKALHEVLDDGAKFIIITRVSHSLVSLYALYKIVATLLTQ